MKKYLKSIIKIVLVVAAILLIVLTLLNPNSHINGGSGGGWDWELGGDFVVMGALLFVFGCLFVFGVGKIKNKTRRIIAGTALFLALLYIWAELAVGIFFNFGS